ncbi:hypothetical protein WN48_07802 [Eufriesea mexicana]|uniref:Uncharacterized protein n=1 Tax=Eufriesea mexicana TaxID=516756 RepID=A0A310SL24_9HYME|nr:hypothetical protein WN48_07802 [Eufriesea mexicana]
MHNTYTSDFRSRALPPAPPRAQFRPSLLPVQRKPSNLLLNFAEKVLAEKEATIVAEIFGTTAAKIFADLESRLPGNRAENFGQRQDAGIVLSPLIGVVVGALVTLVLIILVVVVRVRRERVSKPRHEKPAELSELPPQQYPLQNPQQTVETDPDVIPNKFEGNLVEVSPPSYPGGYPPGHWVTPGPTPSIDELCHKFTGRPTELRLPSRSTIPSLQSMPMTGVMMGGGQGVVVSGAQGSGVVTLGGGQGVVVGTGQGVVVAGECLDGEAIKRRLMANRLPESCV